MSVKRICLGGLVAALLGLGTARGQGPSMGYPTPPPPSPGAEGPPPPPPPQGKVALSNWLVYPRAPGCCGPLGGGLIEGEIYLRGGPSYPIQGDTFSHVLGTGWDIQGGGRSLFFNPDFSRAWTIDLSVSNMNNHAVNQDLMVTLFNIPVQVPNIIGGGTTTTVLPSIPVTIRSLNRTFANAGLGGEWYLMGSGDPNFDGLSWRVGFDAGGRYGTARLDLNEIQHRTGYAAGAWVAVHSDLEYPCGCCIFQAGVRVEWDYNWMRILQDQNNSNLQDINLLFTAGVRF